MTAAHEEVVALLARLVAFDTTSRNSNLAAIAWIEARLTALGFTTERVASDDGAKANLIARIGPDVDGGVVLSGHTDVVPVDGQPWTSDPWTLTERDGRLFGRGAADMKGFLAACLAVAPEMASAPLTRPIHLAFSYDEEVGCLGVPRLIARLLAEGPRPALAIIGEPTMMRVISAHKGIRTYRVIVTGREAHSSLIHDGVSAIMEAAPLLEFVRAAGAQAMGAADGAPFDPPGATMTVGLIEGGTAVNILARRCEFVCDLRAPDEATADALEARLAERVAEADAAIKARAPEGGAALVRRSHTPALSLALDSPAESFARALTGDNGVRAAAYAAEAGLFQRAGVPAVICGPGDIAIAHQPDEWIAPDQLRACVDFLRAAVGRLSS